MLQHHFYVVFNKFIHKIKSQFKITFLNIKRFELFSMAKHLLKYRLNNTSDQS